MAFSASTRQCDHRSAPPPRTHSPHGKPRPAPPPAALSSPHMSGGCDHERSVWIPRPNSLPSTLSGSSTRRVSPPPPPGWKVPCGVGGPRRVPPAGCRRHGDQSQLGLLRVAWRRVREAKSASERLLCRPEPERGGTGWAVTTLCPPCRAAARLSSTEAGPLCAPARPDQGPHAPAPPPRLLSGSCVSGHRVPRVGRGTPQPLGSRWPSSCGQCIPRRKTHLN